MRFRTARDVIIQVRVSPFCGIGQRAKNTNDVLSISQHPRNNIDVKITVAGDAAVDLPKEQLAALLACCNQATD